MLEHNGPHQPFEMTAHSVPRLQLTYILWISYADRPFRPQQNSNYHKTHWTQCFVNSNIKLASKGRGLEFKKRTTLTSGTRSD